MDPAIVTSLLVLGAAIILIAALVGRAVMGRRRTAARAAARRDHEERQQEIHAWLVKDRVERVQRVVREGWGESDPVGTQVLHWLKARQGVRLHMIYTSTDAGVQVRVEDDWMVESPAVFRDHRTGNPEVIWTLSGPARAIELPPRTYHEVGLDGGQLVYRRGWAYWRPHESSEGLTSTHKREEVEVWEQYTFSDPHSGPTDA